MGAVEVVVASGKGGVGKTFFSAELGLALAGRGLRLVAADADAEAPNLHLVLGVDDWDVVDVYREGRVAFIRGDLCTGCGLCEEACGLGAISHEGGVYRVNQWICEGCLTCSLVCPVKAVRYRFNVEAGWLRVKRDTGYGFPLVSARIRPGRPNSGKLVTLVKNTAHRLLGGGDGVVLVDAAAGIGCQVISSLAGAHAAVLVAEPTPAGLHDLRRIHRLLLHFAIPAALVVNKADINPGLAAEIRRYAERNNIMYLGSIPYDDHVPRAMAARRPLSRIYPGSPASKKAVELAGRVVDEIVLNIEEWRMRYRPEKPVPFVPRTIKPDELSRIHG